MEAISQKTYDQDPDKVFKSLLKILEGNFDVKKIEQSVRIVEVSTSMSLFSFGENFDIIVASHNNGSIVQVKAKSKVKWNVTSDVENKAKKIFELLDAALNII